METPNNLPESADAVQAELKPSFLGEALTLYVTEKKNAKVTKSTKNPMEGHQEIIRFVDWYGRDRKISALSPSQIEDYAKEFSQRGAEAQKKLAPVKDFLAFLNKKSWTEVSLATHLRVSRSRRTTSRLSNAALNAPTGPTLSKEGYDRLVSELDNFKEERIRVVEDIKRAMADKDFRENAPLDAAKERQGFVEAKIRELESALTGAQILSSDALANPGRRASVGSNITIKDTDSGKKINYTLVDKREADVSLGKISTVSPVGQALLDRTVGEEIEITVPKGTLRYLIEKVGR